MFGFGWNWSGLSGPVWTGADEHEARSEIRIWSGAGSKMSPGRERTKEVSGVSRWLLAQATKAFMGQKLTFM